MSTVGVIVNPLAGKDIRRLVAHASPVADSAKVGAVRRAVVGAVEAGATEVLVAGDHHRIGERAVGSLSHRLGVRVEVVDEHVRGGRDDTAAATLEFAKRGAEALLVFGGDGTHRDVAAAWPAATIVAVSTGTNNVFPSAWDATAAGVAAGLVACGAVPHAEVTRPAKLLRVHVEHRGGTLDDAALVEVALVDGSFVGSRAVWDPSMIRAVVAAIAAPSATGLAGLAGRAHPVDRVEPCGAVVRLGTGGRRVRVPLAPGSFSDVDVSSTTRLEPGHEVVLEGPGVVALDGERSHVLGRAGSASVRLDLDGPAVVDVDRALVLAAASRLFDVPIAPPHPDSPEDSDGH
jgi:hypothetical protein